MTGHCLCGAITYVIDAEVLQAVICHCDDCQRHSGAAFSTNVIVARDALTFTGTPRVHRTVGADHGNERERLFCGDCGSPLVTYLSDKPGVAVVKAGTLDDRGGWDPAVEVWCETAQPWVEFSAARPRFERDRPR